MVDRRGGGARREGADASPVLTQSTLHGKLLCMTTDEEPLDPARMFELMQSTRRHTQRKLDRIYAGLLFAWAVAWFFGFGALWFAKGVGGVPIIDTGLAWA